MPLHSISRSVESIVTGTAVSDGAGVKLSRVLSTNLQQRLDPFLMLDDFGSDSPDDYLAGFPDHPHRGFETVTYMLEGRMRHRDNAGHEGLLCSGDVQWMTAGRGLIHSEMPEQEQGRMRGFQLWVNLPACDKMMAPRYRGIDAKAIPVWHPEENVTAKIIAGAQGPIRGAVDGIRVEPLYLDIELSGAAEHAFAIEPGHNAFVYVYQGDARIGNRNTVVSAGQMAILGNEPEACGVTLASAQGAKMILLAGRPIGEPIVQWGPFVMNSREEIEQAFADYRSGKL
jgi:hypothetical protein